MWHWISHAFSTYVLHVQNGLGYQWWSGAGANFGELTLLGVAIGAWRHINCQAPWCFRRGPHKTADGLHHLCRKHHPDLPNHRLSLADIHERHREHLARLEPPPPTPIRKPRAVKPKAKP